MIRAVIVDDEPPARKKIRHFLKDEPRIEIAGEAANGLDAVKLLDELRPDLVFLDIQMPKMNGFEVLESVEKRPRYVVFTTAYDEYALKAFEVRALDYLLKPFDADRFCECLERVLENKSAKSHQVQIDDLVRSALGRERYLNRILLKDAGKVFFVRCSEIQWIESEEKYVRLHMGKESHLHRETMNALDERLDPAIFARVHRGAIVNMEFIVELQPWSHGDYRIVLKSGVFLPLGRMYRQKFLKSFQEL